MTLSQGQKHRIPFLCISSRSIHRACDCIGNWRRNGTRLIVHARMMMMMMMKYKAGHDKKDTNGSSVQKHEYGVMEWLLGRGQGLPHGLYVRRHDQRRGNATKVMQRTEMLLLLLLYALRPHALSKRYLNNKATTMAMFCFDNSETFVVPFLSQKKKASVSLPRRDGGWKWIDC